MNILFITTRYPASYEEPIVSGVVKNPFSASVALARAGHDVTVLTDGPRKGTWEVERVVAHGVGKGFAKGVVSAFFVDAKISLQFLRMRREQFDIIHIHSGNLLFFFLLKKMGIVRCPIVYTAHGTSTPELHANTPGSLTLRTILLRLNGFAQEVIDRVMWSNSDMLVSASDYQIEEMKTLYGVPEEKIVRIYNGVDTGRYFPDQRAREAKRKELGIAPHERVVLFVGRMAPKKGVHLLVDACAAMADTHPDVVFLCVSGNTGRYPEYRTHIEELRKRLPLPQRFRIIDDVVEADMPAFYNSADICVFPSLGYESLPTVVYEAMATGVPIITQGSWGTPEVLEEVLLSENELHGKKLPSVIAALLDESVRREAISRSYLRRVNAFSWDTLREEYEKLYGELRERVVEKESKKVILLDYYSEYNRGDAAIQVGLIRLARSSFPQAKISVVAAIGANQSSDLLEHFSQTRGEEVQLYGGLCPTNVPTRASARRFPKHLRALVAAVLFVFCATLFALLLLRVPVAILAPLLPARFATTLRVLAGADIIVWRGTNFRNGNSLLRDIYSTFFWCFQPAVCLALGKPVACVGVSLWEPRTTVSRLMYRAVFRRCIFVAAREDESRGRIEAILRGKGPAPVLMPDLSFVFLKELTGFSISGNRGTTVGVTIVDRHKGDRAGRERYARLMRAMFGEILSDSNANIIIVPQATTYSEDATEIIEDILSGLSSDERARVVVGAGQRSVGELVKEYSHLSYMVATRLHSAVFALASGTPVFAVRYDEGPQWNILSMLGAERFIVEYRALQEGDIVERFKEFRRGEYPSEIIMKNFSRYHDQISGIFAGVNKAHERWLTRKK